LILYALGLIVKILFKRKISLVRLQNRNNGLAFVGNTDNCNAVGINTLWKLILKKSLRFNKNSCK